MARSSASSPGARVSISKLESIAQIVERVALRRGPQDRLDLSGQPIVFDDEPVGCRSKPSMAAARWLKAVNPPETKQVKTPCARMVCTRGAAPGVALMQAANTSPMAAAGRLASNATRRRNPGKAISPRMARSVMAAIRSLRPVGKLIDAFLADRGRIHVGDQKFLAAMSGALHHDIDYPQEAAAAPQPLPCRFRPDPE
jgi:hypothetical protein